MRHDLDVSGWAVAPAQRLSSRPRPGGAGAARVRPWARRTVGRRRGGVWPVCV